MRRKCQFRKKNGAHCNADAQTGNDLCVFHDPDRADDGARARRAGGIRSQPRAVLSADTAHHALRSAEDASDFLQDSINRVRRGELDPKVASVIGYLVSVLLRSFEQGAIEKRIRKAEDTLGFIATPQLVYSNEAKEVEANGKH